MRGEGARARLARARERARQQQGKASAARHTVAGALFEHVLLGVGVRVSDEDESLHIGLLVCMPEPCRRTPVSRAQCCPDPLATGSTPQLVTAHAPAELPSSSKGTRANETGGCGAGLK